MTAILEKVLENQDMILRNQFVIMNALQWITPRGAPFHPAQTPEMVQLQLHQAKQNILHTLERG